jgi:hypothetical protein
MTGLELAVDDLRALLHARATLAELDRARRRDELATDLYHAARRWMLANRGARAPTPKGGTRQ